MVYKYPHARKFFANLASTHSAEEMQGLLVAGVEFPELGIVKIEAEHPPPGLDNFVARLDERLPSNWDILCLLNNTSRR